MALQKRGALAGLTSLRFFAASYVLLFHTRGGKWFGRGFTGVTLFFVLSGFILAYNHPEVLRGERLRFYISRLARIYPLYLFAYLISLHSFLAGTGPGHVSYILTTSALFLLMVHTWYPPFHWVYLAGAWTLSVEMFFYLLFPFVVGWIASLLGPRQRRWKLLIGIMYAVIVLPSIGADLIWMRHNPAAEPLIHHVFSLPVFCLGEFLLGIVLGLRYLHHRPVFSGWHVLAALLFLVACLAVSTPLDNNRYAEFFVNGVFALPYGLLIYTVAGWKSRAMAHPLLQIGGEISFSMYLLQGIIVDVVQTAFHHERGFVPLRFAIFLGCCYLTYRFVEKPSRTYILRLFKIQSHPKPIETSGPAIP